MDASLMDQKDIIAGPVISADVSHLRYMYVEKQREGGREGERERERKEKSSKACTSHVTTRLCMRADEGRVIARVLM